MSLAEIINSLSKSGLFFGYSVDFSPFFEKVFPHSLNMDPNSIERYSYPIIELYSSDIRGVGDEVWFTSLKKLEEKNDMTYNISVHDSFVINPSYPNNTPLLEFLNNKTLTPPIAYYWYVVPSGYDGVFKAFEKSVKNGMKDIKFASEIGAERLVCHATSPKIMFSDNEFEEYTQKMGVLKDYGGDSGIDVLIETGGLTLEQFKELHKEGFRFTLDVAHAKLDEINPIQFYRLFRDSIGEIHLSMNKNGWDAHEGLFCNESGCDVDLQESIKQIIRYALRDRIPLIMELPRDEKNVLFLYNALQVN
jgi:endonuclease IV